MGLSSSQLQPHELVTFKKLPTNVSLESIEIPELAENRRPTNVKWLIILGVFVVLLLPFMIYTLCYADISRLLVGYDKCGNTCGKKNSQWEGIPCSGQDFRDSPYLEYEDSYYGGETGDDFTFKDRRCVQTCKNGYIALMGRCFKQTQSKYQLDAYPGHDVGSSHTYNNIDLDLGIYFSAVKWQLIISCLLAILVAMGMLFLFRFAVAFVVWGILLGCFTGLLILVIAFWYFYANIPEDKTAKESPKEAFLVGGIVLTILAVSLGIILIWCRKKVRLVILLLKETTKAIFDMPALIVIPLACVFVLLFLTAIFALTTAFMATSGRLEKVTEDFYTYASNPVMIFTMCYNLVVFLWLSQFVTGIQYMIIAGAVSKWYFSRDKGFIGSPILNSISIAFKFHLGTVAFGSLLITLIQVFKMVISSLFKNDKVRALVQWCIESIENLFKFLSKNAYIVTAMHGQAFLRSGKRATKLLVQNLGDVIAVNFIGDFVLGMAKILIVIMSLLLTVGIFAIAPGAGQTMNYPSYIIVGVFAALVSCVSFGVFETTIDTIFICYCEDNLLNDGMAKPYLMSRNLREFVEESKEVYKKK